MKYSVVVHYEGAWNFKIEAKDEDEAIDKAQESLQIKIKCDSCLLDYVETTDEA